MPYGKTPCACSEPEPRSETDAELRHTGAVSSANTASEPTEGPPAAGLRRLEGGPEWYTGLIVAGSILLAAVLTLHRLWGIATGPPPPGVGTIAPSFEVQSLDEGVIELDSFRGQVVLVDFWATWCPPCVSAMPSLNRLHQDLHSRGLTVLGVNQEPGAEARVRAFARGRDLTFPIGVDSGVISDEYAVYTLPTSVLIDREGKVRGYYRGLVSESRLRATVEQLLEE